MPQRDPAKTCLEVLKYLRDIPAWPQLPRRSNLENMYVQFSEGFPGAAVRDGKVTVEQGPGFDRQLEALYAAYLENNTGKYPIGVEYAAGLHHCLGLGARPPAVKGQITGPVSFALATTDSGGRPIIYDETLADAAAKFIRLRAGWQEKALRQVSPKTIIFVDEPYMTSFGSAFVQVSREKVTVLLEEVLGGIKGLKGIHCCGNTDWPVLLSTSIDVLSFDAYNYGGSLGLYPAEVKQFLGRGGAIAWGIVPNEEETLAGESVASLRERLEAAMAPLVRAGASIGQLVRQSLLTPSCGLALMSEEGAGRALGLLVELSADIRARGL